MTAGSLYNSLLIRSNMSVKIKCKCNEIDGKCYCLIEEAKKALQAWLDSMPTKELVK